jgi:ABC-type branched-subunit amino acid transport system substrate-binding protein
MLSWRSALLATPALLLASRVMAQSGIFNDRIVFGQAAPLDGPAAALGTGMRDGILAAFNEANKAGGVHGRKLELIARDDGYEPTRSASVTRQLITEDNVFALIGPVGTPTSQAAQPIAAEAGVPFIGPFTGAEFLRDAKLANVINLRASYFQETEEMLERLTRDLGASRIAILFQDDAFGRAGLAGVQRALTKRNMALVAEGTYERNTVAVRGAALAIQRGRPDAVIMVGAYKPCAEFIKTARQLRLNATFVNISFVGSDALAQELGAAGAGVVVTQVVPFPGDESLPMVKRYRAALAAAVPNATPGFVSLEGYAVGRLAIAALTKAPNPPTRDALLNTIRTNSFDIDGMPLSFSAEKNQGSDKVWLTVIQADGSFRAVERLSGTQG